MKACLQWLESFLPPASLEPWTAKFASQQLNFSATGVSRIKVGAVMMWKVGIRGKNDVCCAEHDLRTINTGPLKTFNTEAFA